MDNPWKSISIKDYINHMGHENVYQLQAINTIINNQLNLAYKNIAILGITDGNGLEHIDASKINKIIGIDINHDYLKVCKSKFNHLNDILYLHCIDMINEKKKAIELLSDIDYVIADLIIEHIHLDNFIDIISGMNSENKIVSCVIQHNTDSSVISQSGSEKAFKCLIPLIEEVNESSLINQMDLINHKLVYKEEYLLPNNKSFIRLDFKYCKGEA